MPQLQHYVGVKISSRRTPTILGGCFFEECRQSCTSSMRRATIPGVHFKFLASCPVHATHTVAWSCTTDKTFNQRDTEIHVLTWRKYVHGVDPLPGVLPWPCVGVEGQHVSCVKPCLYHGIYCNCPEHRLRVISTSVNVRITLSPTYDDRLDVPDS